jgi:hypothetical protein
MARQNHENSKDESTKAGIINQAPLSCFRLSSFRDSVFRVRPRASELIVEAVLAMEFGGSA